MKSEEDIPEGYHWITNNPRTIRGIEKREGVEYHQGPPKESQCAAVFTLADLKEMKLVGLYVNISREEYMKRPLTGERI